MSESKSIGQPVLWDAVRPATEYSFWYPGVQSVGSGNIQDQSGNNSDCVLQPNLADATCWANAGYFSTAANGTNDNTYMAIVPPAAFPWDWRTHSLLLSFWMNGAAPGASDDVFGCGGDGVEAGLRLLLLNTGVINPAINGGAQKAGGNTANVFANSTDQHFALAIDGQTQMMYVYANGSLDATYTSGSDVSAAGTGDTTPLAGLAFGGKNDSAGGDATLAMKFKDAHCLLFAGGLPSSTSELVKKLYSRPFYPLTNADISG